MPLLTDAPDAARPLLRPDTAWRRVGADALAPPAASAWRAFGGDGAPWVGPLDGRERLLIVRDEAPASQFGLMQDLLAAGGALADGLACMALTGSRFRGQRGRGWTALRGNLHLSVHLAVDLDAAASQVPLALLPAVATARAIEAASGGRLRPRTKWVNDLLLDGRKVAGVLSATQLQAGRVRHALLGIGVNLARTPELPPSPRVPRPGCLAAFDAGWDGPDAWVRLLPALLREVDAARVALEAGDGASLFAAYRERAGFLGRVATIWPVDEGPDPEAVRPLARGRVLDLRPDLSLVLEGVARPVRTGRMTLDDTP